MLTRATKQTATRAALNQAESIGALVDAYLRLLDGRPTRLNSMRERAMWRTQITKARCKLMTAIDQLGVLLLLILKEGVR